MHKVEYTNSPSIDGTDYNDAPIGFREISEKEFAQSKFFSHNPNFMENRRIIPRDDDGTRNFSKIIDVKIFWFFDKTGIAMTHDFWEGKVHYFACGCDHKYHELSKEECQKRGISHFGMCYHVSECEKCGHIWSVDSSG